MYGARSVKRPRVDVSVRLELAQLVAMLVVVQQAETLITEQTRIHRSESVVRRDPPEGEVQHPVRVYRPSTARKLQQPIGFQI